MNELPPGWAETTLGDVAEVVSGSTPSTREPSYWDGDIPWITPDDLARDRSKLISRGARSITKAGYASCSTRLVPAGAVLYSSRAPIGYAAIATNPVCTNQGFKSFVPSAALASDYLYWYLVHATPEIRKLGSGTTFLELSAVKARGIPIPVAPLAEQRRIVAALEEHLSRLDAASAAIRATAARLHLFVEAARAAAIPDSARATTLGSLLSSAPLFVDGDWIESKDQDPDGDVRLIQLADVGDGEFRDRSRRFLTSDTARRLRCTYLEPGDVLIARMPDPLGRACLFPGTDRRSVTAVDVCIVRCDSDRVHPAWLVHALNSHRVRAQIEALQSGTTRKRISRKNLATVTVRVPSLEEQQVLAEAIDEKLAKSGAMREALLRADRRSQYLRQSILAAAFRGKLTKQDPDDEPASALLERIAAERSAAPKGPRKRREKASA